MSGEKMTLDSWFPCYPAKLIGDTPRLSPHDFGAYWRLLCDYYQNGPLPNDDDDLRNITGVDKADWHRTKGKLMVFFELNGDGRLHNKKADEVIAHREAMVKSTLENSRKGVEARRAKGQLPPQPKDEPKDEPGVEPLDKPLENTSNIVHRTSNIEQRTISISVEGSTKRKDPDWHSLTPREKMLNILGKDEVLIHRPDWQSRLAKFPDRINRIMDSIHAEIAMGTVIKKPGAYAETLWMKALKT